MQRLKSIHYGWVIVAASIIILAVSVGMFNSTNSVFVKPVCESLGFAVGLAYSGSGLGGVIMIPIVSYIIELTDWRSAYRFMGIVGLAILIPTIFFLIRERPEDLGLKPFISSNGNNKGEDETEKPSFNLSLGEAIRTSRFWLLIVAYLFIAAFASATNTHSAPYLSDIGYTTAKVSAVISLFMMFLTVGKIILGVIYDRFGTMIGNIFVAICSIIFPITALLSHIPAVPWIYAVAVGMASCGLSVPLSILITKYFGQKDYPTLFSIFTMVTTLGSSASVPLMGAVYDYWGSYRLAWFVLLILSMIITISLVGAEISYRKEQVEKIKVEHSWSR